MARNLRVGGIIATNRTVVGLPSILAATIPPGGNVLTLSWSCPVTAGSGTPTMNVDGNAATLTLVAHLGQTSTYTVTGGNPAGNAVLYGSTCLLTAAAGVVTGPGGTGNAAASGRSVANLSRTYNQGVFNGTNQWLSRVSDAGTQTGDIDFWFSAWVYLNTLGTQRGVVYKYATSNATSDYQLVVLSSNLPNFGIYSGGTGRSITHGNTIPAGAWTLLTGYHDAVNNTVNIAINNGAFASQTTAGNAPNTTSAPFTIGSYNTGSGEFWNGNLINVMMGKSPVGGIAGLATTIRDTLYNGGQPLRPSQLSTAQKTAWGVVSGWLDTGLTNDVVGSNTLTNNNTVTLTAGQLP